MIYTEWLEQANTHKLKYVSHVRVFSNSNHPGDDNNPKPPISIFRVGIFQKFVSIRVALYRSLC